MEAMSRASLAQVTRHYGEFARAAGFAAIRNETDYDHALALVEAILTANRDSPGREDPDHPLSGLLDLLVPAIQAYEAVHYPMPQVPPHEVLAYLMETQGLTQSELPEVGNQSVVSLVLAGKRRLNARQVAALAKRFKVSAEVFLA